MPPPALRAATGTVAGATHLSDVLRECRRMTTIAEPQAPTAVSRRNAYVELLRTCDCDGSDTLTGAALWWMAVRPCVFPMTAIAVLIGILLAAAAGPFGATQAGLALLVFIGSIAAHAGNNLLNDYIDVREGIDREGYFRTEYAPHPILSGQLTASQVLFGAALLHALDLVILMILVAVVGWGVAGFALAGLLLSVAYVAPPFSFKRRGLGELTAAVVWGPLMIAGAYYALRGAAPAAVWLQSLPYGILVGAVLVGKHLDKLPQDAETGVGTLPVRLGAERSRQLVVSLAHLFLISVAALVVTAASGPWVLLALLALPRLRLLHLAYANPKPAQPPEGYPVWPLWYVAFAMTFTRTAGGFFVLGLMLNLVA